MKTFTVEVTQVVTVPAGQTTPGPWHVEPGTLVEREDPAGYFVCHPKTECDATALCWTERKEDALAMAAAPALLEACESALMQLRVAVIVNSGGLFDHENVHEHLGVAKIMAAIATARGNPNVGKEYANG